MKKGKTVLFLLVFFLLVAVVFFVSNVFLFKTISLKEFANFQVADAEKTFLSDKKIHDSHIKVPKSVKAVYMSQCGAASHKVRSHIKKLIEDTELNAVVIDIKDYTGTVSFPSKIKGANTGKGCVVKDMKDLVEDFHKSGIYVIGRITVFQDPLYAREHPDQAVQSRSKNAPWSDYKGLHFIDVGSKKFWRYIVKLAHEAHQEYMFDELNFDYIRYPSDGPMRDAKYTLSDYSKRSDELEKFFRYLNYHVKVPDKMGHVPVISADLFGMVTTNYDDLTIGQVLEKALPYFDYIAPMVYPSHYPKSFLGLGNPNKHVYKVVNYCMKKAVARVVATSTPISSVVYKESEKDDEYIKPSYSKLKLRPWLQDFDYGGNYGAKEVRAQIQAVYDAGLNSWMLWDPANRYTREALLPGSR